MIAADNNKEEIKIASTASEEVEPQTPKKEIVEEEQEAPAKEEESKVVAEEEEETPVVEKEEEKPVVEKKQTETQKKAAEAVSKAKKSLKPAIEKIAKKLGKAYLAAEEKFKFVSEKACTIANKIDTNVVKYAGEQKPFAEVSFTDIFYWRNVYLSAAVLFTIQIVFFMLVVVQLPLGWVIARAMQIQFGLVVAYIGYGKVMKMLGNEEPATLDLATTCKIAPEDIQRYVSAVVGCINCSVSNYINLLLFTNVKNSLIFIVGLEFASRILGCCSTVTNIWLVVLAAFTFPVLNERFGNRFLEFYQLLVKQIYDAAQKIPVHKSLKKTEKAE